jgi:putative methyltransferase (TIGR04325 family)
MHMALIERLHQGVDALAGWPLLRAHLMKQARQAFVDNRSQNLFFGVHDSWAQAEQAAHVFGAVGYDHDSTVDLYAERTRKDPHDYPALYWLLRSMHEGHRSVFDVGGNIGIKYLAFKDALAPYTDLTWRVQDVTSVVEHGRVLARERGDGSRLEFTDRFEDGEGIDLLYASGVLQYLPQTLGELLGRYRQLPRRIVINTTAIHPEREFYTVNSIWTAFCPYRVQTQARLIQGLSSLGYRLREAWINPDKPLVMPYQPALSLSHYSGYCLDLLVRG